ncbi:clumping factor B [Penicillium taxi]|uniref:clumping factor B n=1 Tax=Penicillium taxi TaxID=168475 RepID=UPI0025455DBB|nr:clumping factor B [Penicillium taxi]KAJ5893379.1 clumping factor B [Penicillium taxi]
MSDNPIVTATNQNMLDVLQSQTYDPVIKSNAELNAEVDVVHRGSSVIKKDSADEEDGLEPDDAVDDKHNDANWSSKAAQKKLDVKITECIYDSISMSAPPFPFVQGWDKDTISTMKTPIFSQPQDMSDNKRKRNRKKQKCNNNDFQEQGGYEEDYDGYEGYEGCDDYGNCRGYYGY